jgi:hypothetical protein
MLAVRACRAGVSRGEAVILLAVAVVVLALGAAGCRRAQQAEQEAESENNLKKIGAAHATSRNNLKQLGVAGLDCASANDNHVPPVFGYFPGRQATADGPNKEPHSIFFHLLPYLEQNNVYNTVSLNSFIQTFCPRADPTNDQSKVLTSYAANERLFGRVDGGLTMPAMFYNRATANTIAFVERYAERNGHWAGKDCVIDQNATIDFDLKPPGKEGNFAHAFTFHGCNVCLGDGTVKTFAPGTKDEVFRWGLDPQRDEPQPEGW